MEKSQSSLNHELQEKMKDPDFVKSHIEEFITLLTKRNESATNRFPVEIPLRFEDISDLPSLSDYRLKTQALVLEYLREVDEVTEQSVEENVDLSLNEIKKILIFFM